MKKPLTKKALKQAKKQFPRVPHQTRPFSVKDYEALPLGEMPPETQATQGQ